MGKSWRVGVVGLAVGALALTGCGRSDESGSTSPSTGATVTEDAVTGAIDVWAMGTEGEALEEFAATFTEAYPGTEVNVTAIPWDAAHDKISTAIAGGQTPDVSMIGTTWMGEFAATGAFDVTPDLIDSSAFFPGAWDSTEVGGTSYGVPWYVETRVLYYLADKVATPPADWAGLTQMCADLKADGVTWPVNLPPGGTGAWQTFLPFAWQAGATLTNEDGTEFTIDSPEFVEALTYYQSMFESGCSPTDLPAGTLESDFVAGTIGSFVSGPWHVGILRDTGGQEFLDSGLGMATLPQGAQPASFIGGANLAVFQDSDNRDTAWTFVNWLSQPETQVEWYKTVNDLPSVSAAWDDPAIADDTYLQVFGEQMTSAVAPPSIPTWEQIAGVIDTELEKLTKTGADPQETATFIQQQAAAIGTGL